MLLSQTFWPLVAVFLIGTLVGSFLNVLVFRLPRILTGQASELSQAHPRLHCLHCGHSPQWHHLIPILSYLWLRGRCAFCRARIPFHYPLLEVLAGLIALGVVWRFEDWPVAVACAVLGWGLLALIVIDWQARLLPDIILYPLLWLGLLINLDANFTPLHTAVVGAVVAYLSLWSLHHLFRLITGTTGMGHGDFKLFAVCGAWLGWTQLPWVLLLASVMAIVGWLLQAVFRTPVRLIAFGPPLALALVLQLIWPGSIEQLLILWSGASE